MVVYAGNGGAPYRELAGRLHAACAERSQGARLLASGEMCRMAEEHLAGATLLVVGPRECAAGSGDEGRFLAKFASARRRVAVLSEPVRSESYREQLSLPADFDAVLDVGFISQGDGHLLPEIPYRFVLDTPTGREWETLADLSPSRRPIPWAAIAERQTPENVALAAELVERLDPGGLVFMPDLNLLRESGEEVPDSGMMGEGVETLSPRGLEAIFSKIGCYVWTSRGTNMRGESYLYLKALLKGVVPCRVDGEPSWTASGVPGSFHSVRILCEAVRGGDLGTMYDAAREFCLSGKSLGENLEEALRSV